MSRRFRHPLAEAHNRGAGGDGVAHWWAQRFTAILLIPVTVWLIWAAATLVGADHATAAGFFAHPVNATLAIVLIVALFYHGQLGLQVIIEDYVHRRGLEVTLQILVKAGAVIGGLLGLVAILKLAVGG